MVHGENIKHFGKITNPAFEIRDAVILKQKGHESEPVVTINREGNAQLGNFIIIINPLYSSNPQMQTMNLLRRYISHNAEMYIKLIAEFAGVEKEWTSTLELSKSDQYGVVLTNIIIFPRYSYDNRNPLQLLSVPGINIENCVILNEKRIVELPQPCQKAIKSILDTCSDPEFDETSTL